MNPVEHSKLLFLVDSIRVAPHKCIILLELASHRRKECSDKYMGYINRLNEVSSDIKQVRDLAIQIKKEIL